MIARGASDRQRLRLPFTHNLSHHLRFWRQPTAQVQPTHIRHVSQHMHLLPDVLVAIGDMLLSLGVFLEDIHQRKSRPRRPAHLPRISSLPTASLHSSPFCFVSSPAKGRNFKLPSSPFPALSLRSPPSTLSLSWHDGVLISSGPPNPEQVASRAFAHRVYQDCWSSCRFVCFIAAPENPRACSFSGGPLQPHRHLAYLSSATEQFITSLARAGISKTQLHSPSQPLLPLHTMPCFDNDATPHRTAPHRTAPHRTTPSNPRPSRRQ